MFWVKVGILAFIEGDFFAEFFFGPDLKTYHFLRQMQTFRPHFLIFFAKSFFIFFSHFLLSSVTHFIDQDFHSLLNKTNLNPR